MNKTRTIAQQSETSQSSNDSYSRKPTMEQLQAMSNADREAMAREYGIKTEGKHHLQVDCELWEKIWNPQPATTSGN